jgi:hypothetical protein
MFKNGAAMYYLEHTRTHEPAIVSCVKDFRGLVPWSCNLRHFENNWNGWKKLNHFSLIRSIWNPKGMKYSLIIYVIEVEY